MANGFVNNPWTEEREQTLIRLVGEGYSGGIIANELGVSRNSVIGKVHRLGLQLGVFRKGYPKTETRRYRKAHPGRPKSRKPFKEKPGPVFETAPIPPQHAEDIARKSFSELSENSCRYPVGHVAEPGFGFCGSERMPGSPYCCGHHQRCYVPVPPKKAAQRRETAGVMA